MLKWIIWKRRKKLEENFIFNWNETKCKLYSIIFNLIMELFVFHIKSNSSLWKERKKKKVMKRKTYEDDWKSVRNGCWKCEKIDEQLSIEIIYFSFVISFSLSWIIITNCIGDELIDCLSTSSTLILIDFVGTMCQWFITITFRESQITVSLFQTHRNSWKGQKREIMTVFFWKMTNNNH